MSGDCMKFPDTVKEFMEQYKVVDKEGIYMSKGAELVPIFRMEQWFEHEKTQLSQVIESLPSKQSERRIGYWIIKTEHPIFGLNNKCVCCSKCNWVAFHDTKLGQRIIIENEFNYCPNCGADMRGKKDG